MACRRYIQWYISYLSSVTIDWCLAPHRWGFYITHSNAPVGRTPLEEWSARRRDLHLTTHNTTDRHPSPCGIRTHNLSRRAAADPSLSPRGHWDRPSWNWVLEISTFQHYCSLITIRITGGKKSQILHSKAPKPALGRSQPPFQGYRGPFPDGTATGNEDDNLTPPGATVKKQYAVMARRGTTLPPCITYFEDHSHEARNKKNIQFSACLCLQISALNRERYKNIMDYNASEKRNKTADMNPLNRVAGTADTSAVNQQTCAKFF